jgi:hypothetical protein
LIYNNLHTTKIEQQVRCWAQKNGFTAFVPIGICNLPFIKQLRTHAITYINSTYHYRLFRQKKSPASGAPLLLTKQKLSNLNYPPIQVRVVRVACNQDNARYKFCQLFFEAQQD